MKCLETRLTSEGYKRRRYESPLGVRYTTVEIPIEVWRALNKQGRGADRISAWGRARERERQQAQARALYRAGRAAKDIAELLKKPVRTVNRWIAKAKHEHQDGTD